MCSGVEASSLKDAELLKILRARESLLRIPYVTLRTGSRVPVIVVMLHPFALMNERAPGRPEKKDYRHPLFLDCPCVSNLCVIAFADGVQDIV